VLAVYLVAVIVGGALLAVSLVSGHHAPALEAHAPGELGAHHAGAGHALLSLRFWTYLLAFGGAAGLALRLLAQTPEPWVALASAAVGALAGGGAHLVVARLASARGGTVRTEELVGRTGRLLLPAAPGQSSRVRLSVGGALIDLTATTDEKRLEADEEVLVVQVKDGVAQVTRNPVRGGGNE
jgi:membrane protein implicated in regulation of membrane protease activity